jgi:hypothetical protein
VRSFPFEASIGGLETVTDQAKSEKTVETILSGISRKNANMRNVQRTCSLPAPAFCDLQIEADTLAIDKDCACIDQLLAGTVVALVTAQGGEWEEECHGLRTPSGGNFSSEMEVRAEANAVELQVILEISKNGSQ